MQSIVSGPETDNLAGVQRPGERAIMAVSRLGLPLALSLALLVRLALILGAPGVLDGDEALVGIQAERIAAGTEHPLPVFFYGQPYMGSLEAYLAAAIFRLIGPSVPALRLVPLVFALLLVALTYELTRRVAGRDAATIAALLAAVPPLYVGVWSLKARGGYVETVALGSALLIVTHRLLYSRAEAQSPTGPLRRSRLTQGWWLLWGALAGLLFWINPISSYYIATGAGALLLAALRRRGWRLSRSDLRLSWPPFVLVLAGLLIGGLPLWVANVYSRGATFGYLFSGSGSSESLLSRVPRVADYLGWAVLPKLTGAWEPWGAANSRIVGGAILAVYALALAYLLIRLVAGRRGVLSYRARPRHGQGLLLAFAAIVAVIFCVSGFGGIALNPLGFDAATRYALPLVSVLPVAAGALLWRLWRIWAPLSAAVLAALLIVSVSAYVSEQAGAAFQSEYWSKLPASEARLAGFLESRGIRHVWMNHWAGYPLMFYADGRIVAADYNDVVVHGGVNRLPWAMREVAGDPQAAYVLVTAEATPQLETLLTARHVRFAKERLGPYVVYWRFQRPVPPQSVAAGLGFAY